MSSDGREQVTNFFMAGEMIGLDGISSNVYSCDVVALEDTEVCVLPFDRVEQATTTIQTMGKHFQKLLSREIVRQHGVMLLLGSMHAEERLAAAFERVHLLGADLAGAGAESSVFGLH